MSTNFRVRTALLACMAASVVLQSHGSAEPRTRGVPLAPTALAQVDPVTGAVIPTGTVLPGNRIRLQATVAASDPNGWVRLEVQVLDRSDTWDAVTPEYAGASVYYGTGMTAYVELSFVGENAFKWRARTSDPGGSVSAWVEFGGPTDFVHLIKPEAAPPVAPLSLTQRDPSTGVAIPLGGISPGNSVRFQGVISTLDGTGSVRLEVQVNDISDVFDYACSFYEASSSYLAPGAAAHVDIRFVGDNSFHWRARTRNASGAVSDWVYFGDNGGGTDFVHLVVPEEPGSRDKTPPVITSLTASPDTISPPNHKMIAVTISGTATDAVDPAPTLKILAVTSNEPTEGLGDGDTPVDWEVTGAMTLNLRAERSGKGSGRVYTITVQATDASGNSSLKSVTVTVPKLQGK